MRNSNLLRLICLLISLFMAISLLGACSSCDQADKDASSKPSDTADGDTDEWTDGEEEFDGDDEFDEGEFEDEFYDDEFSNEDWEYGDEELEEDMDAASAETLNIYNDEAPISTNYRGASGSIYHAYGHMLDDKTGRAYTDEMMDIELTRLLNAGIRNCRTAFEISWIWNPSLNGGYGGYDWNTPRANYFFDYCKNLQDRGADVAIQIGWHIDAYTHYNNHEGKVGMGGFPYLTRSENFPTDVANETAGYDFSQHSDPEYKRMALESLRAGYAYAETIKQARARGLYNIKYLYYFVECSYEYQTSPDDPNYGHGGQQPAEYCFVVDRMQYKFKQEGVYDLVKHVGPNQSNEDGDGLARYCLDHYGPEMFDIWTQHFYPRADDPTNNIFYDICNPVFDSYMEPMRDYGIAGVEEFWVDEYNTGITNRPLGDDNAWTGLQSVVGFITGQQNGIDNFSLWQLFDQLWTDSTSTGGEFINGIHACGMAPSLFVSSIPHGQFYPVSLFGKYNGYQNGKSYRTNEHDLQAYASDIHVGAVQLEDGKWTISVVNAGVDEYTISVNFDKAINQTLYRHVENVNTNIPSTAGKIADADKTFANVKDKFVDTIEGGSVVIYTGVKG